jgi:hypothetical protein
MADRGTRRAGRKVNIGVNLGLGAGCVLIATLMALIGTWFMVNGVKDRDWSAIVVAALILAVAAFALSSAVGLFLKA